MYSNIEEAMLGLKVWKKHRKVSISPLAKNLAYKPTFDAEIFREAAVYRFIELTESTYVLYKSNLLIGSITTARAAYETLAVLWFLNTKLEHLTKTKDIAHFLETIRRLLLGWSNDAEFPEKINVLKCADAVDKTLEGVFRRHYEMLCEYAHPNNSGTFGSYTAPDHSTLEVQFGAYLRNEEILKSHIQNTVVISLEMLNHVQENYENIVNDALDTCHELHEQGKLKVAYDEAQQASVTDRQKNK